MIHDSLLALQQEYFSLLENNQLIRECCALDDNHFKIPSHLMDQKGIYLHSQKGYVHSSIYKIELLYESVMEFWKKHADEQASLLNQLEGRYIHVQINIAKTLIRKYCTFFNGVLISDQFMLSREEYIGKPQVTLLEHFVISTVRTAFKYLLDKDKIFLPKGKQPLAYVVPARMYFEPNILTIIEDASTKLAIQFVSEMLNREFNNPYNYMEYCESRKLSESDLDPSVIGLL